VRSGGKAKAAAEHALAEMGMSDAKHRRVKGFSKGMRQRTKLATAIAHDPDFLLLDEPLTGVDPMARIDIVERIRKLGEAGKTIITTTHELDIVPIIASRVIVIGEERRILADGTPEEILNDHALLIRANLIHEHLHEQGVRHGHGHLMHEHLPATERRGRPAVGPEQG
jgi:cobalt/nickel transport system ATP-binding protein